MSTLTDYTKVCREASENDLVFADFKNNFNYTKVLEHVHAGFGAGYLERIIEDSAVLLEYLPKFITNDNVGNPKQYYYKEIGMKISPTTLRYIKVLGDLQNIFGSLNGKDIIEIGGGYGGQCKIIYDVCAPKTYTIVDLPDVLALTGKYLKKFDIKNIILKTAKDQFEDNYDICISNYAFTEVNKEYRDLYAKKVISHSSKGYMTCNFIKVEGYPGDQVARSEIKKLQKTGVFIPEVPITGIGNIIYIWNNELGPRR